MSNENPLTRPEARVILERNGIDPDNVPTLIAMAIEGVYKSFDALDLPDNVKAPSIMKELERNVDREILTSLVEEALAESGPDRELLRQQSLTDYLTDLGNKRGYADHLTEMLDTKGNQHRRGPQDQGGVIYVDLAGFKRVNDQFGLDAGDLVLQLISQRLVDTTREETDYWARPGGDEFAGIVKAPLDQIVRIGERIIDEAEKPIFLSDEVNTSLGAYVGIASNYDTERNIWLPAMQVNANAARALNVAKEYANKRGESSLLHVHGSPLPDLPLRRKALPSLYGVVDIVREATKLVRRRKAS